jgi:hypothetical protein
MVEGILAKLSPEECAYLRSALGPKIEATRADHLGERDEIIRSRCARLYGPEKRNEPARNLEAELIREAASGAHRLKTSDPNRIELRLILELNGGIPIGFSQIKNILRGQRTPIAGQFSPLSIGCKKAEFEDEAPTEPITVRK